MGKQKGFSYYDIEEFLRDAGAKRINEGAVVSFERELEDTVKNLIDEAGMYANYAGRQKKITYSDVDMARTYGTKKRYFIKNKVKPKRMPNMSGKRIHKQLERNI